MFVDPLAEQTMEPYLYTGNNPIMFTDPTGMTKDDHYFNQRGEYLYSDTRSSDNIRVISDEDFSSISWKYSSEMSDKSKSYSKLLDALDSKSRIVTEENSGSKFASMWSNSLKTNTERIGYSVLNFEKATLSFEVASVSPNANSNTVPLEYHAGDIHSSGGIVLGSAHTHPTEHVNLGKRAAVDNSIITDQAIFNHQYSVPIGDGNTAARHGPTYTISRDNVDYYSPAGKRSSINNVSTRNRLESNKFNLNRHALFKYNKR